MQFYLLFQKKKKRKKERKKDSENEKKIFFEFLLQLFLLKVVKVGDLSLCLQGCNLEQLFSEFSHVELVHRE